ncbi:hypothetical protein [Nocardioides sp. 1609]|uniref:hypothetical protein n=1 Tax=Nocardioides sp. 1609 TaxID=2508327 RepID=UPI00143043A7|nr:hypothetical protein [Nocardioides sp. 1609]
MFVRSLLEGDALLRSVREIYDQGGGGDGVELAVVVAVGVSGHDGEVRWQLELCSFRWGHALNLSQVADKSTSDVSSGVVDGTQESSNTA